MGFLDRFSGNTDAIRFCEVLTKMNKMMIQFNNKRFDGNIDKALFEEINDCYCSLIELIKILPPGRIENMMEKSCQRYTDGVVQVAFIGKANVTLSQTWYRSQMDFKIIEAAII